MVEGVASGERKYSAYNLCKASWPDAQCMYVRICRCLCMYVCIYACVYVCRLERGGIQTPGASGVCHFQQGTCGGRVGEEGCFMATESTPVSLPSLSSVSQ